MVFQDLPIRRKVTAVIMLTSIISLLITAAGFMVYDAISFRGILAHNLSIISSITADNSSGVLAFPNEPEAQAILARLRAEPHIVAAALYDEKGQLFVHYPAHLKITEFPAKPRKTGPPVFENGHLIVFQPVMQGTDQVGTAYLKSDLKALTERLRLYAVIALLVFLSSAVVAYALSNVFQRHISAPVLALTNIATVISERGDYSVRAAKVSRDELGLLTNAFNQMLTRIQEQTVELREGEERLRLALEASHTGTWHWNLKSNQMTWDRPWDEKTPAPFGPKAGVFGGTFDDFAKLIDSQDRAGLTEAIKQALDKKTPFNTEFRVVWPDGSTHYLAGRGKGLYDEGGKPVQMTGVILDITERKEAEEIRSFLAAIVESTHDAVVGRDMQGRILSWNSGAERMFGFSASEILGQPIKRIISPDRPEEEFRILHEVRQGRTCHYETLRLHKDRHPIEVSLTASPVKNARGEIIGISSIARDITERRRGERELQESRARLSGVIGSAMDAIISVDAQQRITMFNAAAEQMFRCSAADALGQSLERFIPADFRAAHQKHIDEFGRTGVTTRAMGSLRPISGLRADGEKFPIEASISQIDVSGEKIYTVILRDITERNRAQAVLEHQAAILREQTQMLDLANVLARDLEGRIILWNTGMEKIYGWTKKEALGKVAHELLRTEFPQPQETIRAALLGHGSWEGELTHLGKAGQRLIVASQWVLHLDAQGRPAAILEIHNDITERKLAQEEILQLNAELEQRVTARTAELTAANKELEAFTYSVAHDLRAPLRHIDAFTKILHEDFAPELPQEAQHYLENIRNGSRNMNRLVDDLLNLAHVGRQELRRQDIDLGMLVIEVLADLKRETGSRAIEWRIHPLPTAQCDAGLMKQVFANLLANAVKYTRPREVAIVEVGSINQNGSAAVFVRDNGVGFNMKYADKLFGVFQRLHRAEDFEGTGVGLATVERIVRRHGGTVWAEGAIGQGATFYFTIGATGEPHTHD